MTTYVNSMALDDADTSSLFANSAETSLTGGATSDILTSLSRDAA